jgi:regulator of sigma E protease
MSFELVQSIVATKIYPALLVLFFFGITILIHEYGHFIVAKKRGMKIERFSLGFGPAIFAWKKDGIEYRISWIPFGGYVALPQMAPMEAVEGKSDAPAPSEPLPPVSPGTKILVALAGPTLNIALAVVLATGVYFFGLPTPVNPSVIGGVEAGSREEQLGIREGDRVVKINDKPVKTWDQINFEVAVSSGPNVKAVIERDGNPQEYLLETEMVKAFGVKVINLYPQGHPYVGNVRSGSPAEHAGIQSGDKFLSVEGLAVATQGQLRDLIGKRPNMPTKVKVLRGGQTIDLTVTPALDPVENVGRMGVELSDQMEFEIVRPGPTPVKQFDDALSQMGRTFQAIWNYRETKVGLDSMSGPIGISVGWWAQIVHGGFLRGLWFAVIINIALAVFNLLPLPVLDGGHIVFSLIEAAIRRPLNPVFLQRITMAFAALLIGFMLYVTFHDVRRFIPFPRKSVPQAAPAVPEPQPAPSAP